MTLFVLWLHITAYVLTPENKITHFHFTDCIFIHKLGFQSFITMYRFNMSFQVSSLGRFIFTLVTGVGDITMDRFNVSFSGLFFSCFIFTLFTGVSDITMYRFNV